MICFIYRFMIKYIKYFLEGIIMFAADRISKIKELLLEYKQIDINSLCSILGCSVATVRRDLDRLEGESFLRKTYGGAILDERQQTQSTSSITDTPYFKEKYQIALIAVELVHNNDIIYLGPGLTCLLIAQNLKNKENLRIVTNNINIVMELSGIAGIRVFLLGGDISGEDENVFTVGHHAEDALDEMFINKAFFTVDGISSEYGCTLNNYEQTLILRKVLSRSDDSILIADESKFDKKAFVKALDLKTVNKVITNIGIDASYKEYMFNNQIELFTTFEDV